MIVERAQSHMWAHETSVEEVAKKFKCGIEIARQTLKTTTQYGVRHAIHPLH
jgi:hypothetical protein